MLAPLNPNLSQMARHAILAHSVAFVAACLVASCTTQETIPEAEEPPLTLVKWDDLPLELKKMSVPPYSAISYCAVHASAQGSDADAVKADLAECLSADSTSGQSSFDEPSTPR